MQKNKQSRTLDENLIRSVPQQSVFLSEETIRDNGIDETRLECFNPRYATAAENLSAATKFSNLGKGKPGEIKRLGNTELCWKEQSWTSEGVGFSLDIGPECDEQDTKTWLKKFETLQKNVLQRHTTKREQIHFVLGKKANERQPKPCVAFAEDNTIGFPTTTNGSHLVAVKLCEASEKQADLKKVRLEKITLHEIGHTLKKFFEFEREEILLAMMLNGPKCWNNCAPLLGEISPHYLGEQAPKIEATLLANQMAAEVEPTRENEKVRNKFAYDIGREIFAELVRHFYLEPALDQKIKPFSKTGIHELDEFCTILSEEAAQTLEPKPKPIHPRGIEID